MFSNYLTIIFSIWASHAWHVRVLMCSLALSARVFTWLCVRVLTRSRTSFFSKNEHFRSWIVLSTIFKFSHSGPAQDTIIPLISSFGENFYRWRIVFDYVFAFSKKEHFWSRFCPLRKITKTLHELGGQILVLVTDVFKLSLDFSRYYNLFLPGTLNHIGNN